MLEYLEPINWEKLGPGGSLIARFLREVTSADPVISHRACEELGHRLAPWPTFDPVLGTIRAFRAALQNDIPQCTVPFLIALVANKSIRVEHRKSLLDTLYNLACYVYAAKTCTSPGNSADAVYRTRALAIRQAVRLGMPLFEALQDSEHESLRFNARDMLRMLQIDWEALGVSGFLIPTLLKEVRSSDPSLALHAVQTLSGRAANWPAFDADYGPNHDFKFALQDDIPQYIIPILIEWVADNSIKDTYRSTMLEALGDAARYIYAARVYTDPHNPADEVYRIRALIIREAVRLGMPIYALLQHSEHKSLRLDAKDILRILEDERGGQSQNYQS